MMNVKITTGNVLISQNKETSTIFERCCITGHCT